MSEPKNLQLRERRIDLVFAVLSVRLLVRKRKPMPFKRKF